MKAVTFGRYTVCTHAHLHTCEMILKHFDSVSIGVIDGSLVGEKPNPRSPQEKTFFTLADKQHQKTFLTITERINLMRHTLSDAGLLHKVSILPIARPEYTVRMFNQQFPSRFYQLVFPRAQTADTEFDAIRNESLSAILDRSIMPIGTTFTLHTSAIRNEAVADPQIWQRYMTPRAYQYFLSINGPERSQNSLRVV